MKTAHALLFFGYFASPLFASDAASLIQQGDVHDRAFRPREALSCYLPAAKITPNDPALLVRIARQYVYSMEEVSSDAKKREAGETALRYAEEAARISPTDSDAHLSIAISLGKMTPLMSNKEKVQVSRCIKQSAEEAVRLNPRSDYAWHLLGRWHQALANMSSLTLGIVRLVYGSLPPASNTEAVRCFQKAIELQPTRLIHHIELGRTYAQMDKETEARAEITKGLSMPNTERDDDETKRRGRATLAELD
jgi:tetratricopeptide (TPR) repeat protein